MRQCLPWPGPATRLLAVLLLLCAGSAAAATAAPHLTAHGFVAADGTVLPLRRWLPKAAPKAVILALHGFNDYSKAFAAPAKLWAAAGIATYAYDQRGFGAAPGHGHWPGRPVLVADADLALKLLHRRYPGVPVYLLGESMGGAVAILSMTGETEMPIPKVAGVVLVAPAVWGWKTMDLLPRVALSVAIRLFAGAKLTGQGLGVHASDNVAMLRQLSLDPLVIKATRVDTIYGLVALMDAALDAAPKLDQPLLLLYGAHDELIPSKAMQVFLRQLPRRPHHPRRIAYYRHGYHMLLRDLEGPLVAEDIASWIRNRAAPLPSGADRAAAALLDHGDRK